MGMKQGHRNPHNGHQESFKGKLLFVDSILFKKGGHHCCQRGMAKRRLERWDVLMVMSDSGNEYHTVLNDSITMCDSNSMT